jgi:hypothetical protein
MQARFMEFPSFADENECIYFKAENLVLRVRSESVGFAEIVNKNRMVGTKAFMPFRVQRHRVKTKRLSFIIS